MRLPPIPLLQGLYAYNPETGSIVHRQARSGVRAGYTALSCARNGEPIVRITVDRCRHTVRADRLAWALTYEHWPEGKLVRKNGMREDLRLSNLEPITLPEEPKGRLPCGVSYEPLRNRLRPFKARIRVGGQMLHLGYFKTIDEAAGACREARQTVNR